MTTDHPDDAPGPIDDLIPPDPPIFNDMDGVGLRFPEAGLAIAGWIDDPAPKLRRLTIHARLEEDPWPMRGPAVRIRMHLYGEESGPAIWAGEGRVGLGLMGRELTEAIHRTLDELHYRAINELRWRRRGPG
jgi:hypothetical protein